MGLDRTPPATRKNSQTESELEREIVEMEKELEAQTRESNLNIGFNHQQKDHKYTVNLDKLSKNVQASIVNCDMTNDEEIKNIANLVRDSKAVKPFENPIGDLTFFRGYPYQELISRLQKLLNDLEPNNIKILEVDNKINNIREDLEKLSMKLSMETERKITAATIDIKNAMQEEMQEDTLLNYF